MENPRGTQKSGRVDEEVVAGLCLGDAILFFLDAERVGGRSESVLLEYRKKLDLFLRWFAVRPEGQGAVDTPVSWVGPDEGEGYVTCMRERGPSDSSIKNRFSIVRSFFDTLSRRLELPDPTRRLDEVLLERAPPSLRVGPAKAAPSRRRAGGDRRTRRDLAGS